MPRKVGAKDKKKRKVTPNKGMFQKGNKKQPKGSEITRTAPATVASVTNARVDKALVDRYLRVNSHLTVEQLITRLKLEGVSVLEGMLIKSMLKAYRTGDPHNVNFILDRLIGKVPTRVAHSLENELKDLDDEQLKKKKEMYSLALRSEIEHCEKQVETKLKDFENTKFIDDDGEIRKAKDIVEIDARSTDSANKSDKD